MSTTSLSRKAKAGALVPLALLSGVYTASLLSTSATAVNTSATPRNLPDGTTVPTKAIEAPASVPVAGLVAPAVPQGAADAVVSGASANGIPAPALSAYQRAAQIIDAADKSCNIPWELIGAIGRVESDHGRYNGNSIDSKGFSRPGIYGIPLNGKNGTQAIRDTDGGQLDKDPVFDRAVGPMQFIPSTWQVVKVDADGDGQRNPQDMNDAALATAVYLCSGSDNLGTRKGQEASVLRYNHSQDYVNLVLRIMEAYTAGDYSAVPSGTQAGTSFSSSSYSSAISRSYKKAAATAKARAKAAQQRGRSGGSASGSSGSGSGGGSVPGTSGSTGGAAVPGTGGGSGSTGGSVGGTVGGVVGGVTGGIKKAITPSSAPAPSTPTPVKQVLSLTQAKLECGKKYNAITQAADFTKCVTSLTS
ncbi:MAG: Transglycosylase protein [Marmoricola sp.]|nr:Transglycosylase protein [Marmoricola sp.]